MMTETDTLPTPVVAQDAIVLIDLSSIAHPIWHMSQAHPDANHASQAIVERVRDLARGFPHVAICCDAGKSFRHELTPSYKANRPESEAPLHHQILLATEQLQADGFPIWSVKGFEADDVIATACSKALAIEGGSALIVSADKDLLQLVGPRVLAKSVRDGAILDDAAVWAKFGVRPDQMRDYLTLVGDASDNIHGAKGIGPKTAAALLATFDTLDTVYTELAQHGTKFKPATASALRELQPRLDTVRALISLRTDVAIPFEEIAAERVEKPVAFVEGEAMEGDPMETRDADAPTASTPDLQGTTTQATAQPERLAPQMDAPATNGKNPAQVASTALVPELAPPPAEWERQLDPRSMKQAQALATDMYASRMFSAYGTPAAILSTIMVGRELGIPAMASLRSIHNIEGKHALSAQLMVALVLKSGLAEYFELVSLSDTEAVFETQRRGARNPVRLTHTIVMAQAAGLVKPNSNWAKIPTDMLAARCQSRLVRLVYPDVVGALYTPDELQEARQQASAA